MTGTLTKIRLYPVKGLSGTDLPEVTLRPGEGLPGDRMLGFARPGTAFDAADPRPMPKTNFLVLMRDAALAGLHTSLDGRVLTIDGRTHDLDTEAGRASAEAVLAAAAGTGGTPRLVEAAPHRFTDVSVVSPRLMNAVSVLNLASVRAFADDIGAPVDPERFRANLLLDGWPPFAELDAVGREIVIGPARLRIVMRTKRCAATEVNPDTAERDLEVPRLIHRHYGHPDMGVYAEVLTGGALRPGQGAALADAPVA